MAHSNYLRKRIKRIKQDTFRPVDATALYVVANFSIVNMLSNLFTNRMA